MPYAQRLMIKVKALDQLDSLIDGVLTTELDSRNSKGIRSVDLPSSILFYPVLCQPAGPRHKLKHNQLSRFILSRPLINHGGRSDPFAFSIPIKCFLSNCVSRLLRNPCSFRLGYSRIIRTQHGNHQTTP